MLKPLPIEFLKEIAREYALTSHQEETFVARYSVNDDVRDDQLAAELHISPGAFRTRMTGVYKKFSIAGEASGKFYKLRVFLSDRAGNYGTVIEKSAVDIDTLVQQVRSQIEPVIRSLCGTMRVLDMDQPIELTGDRGIYINVNILEKLTRLQSEQEILTTGDRSVFNRQSKKTLPGLKAVDNHNRLIVLGKPGSGKTTFLKYLALHCITGSWRADSIPFFVVLKDFAEAPGKPSLIQYLTTILKQRLTAESLEEILTAERFIVLLDGLDEVQEEDTGRVVREIREFSDQVRNSAIVMTYRIAAAEYVFRAFQEVEIADFSSEEIEVFIENWFRLRSDIAEAENFMKAFYQDKSVQNLATNPLLLTFLCLVFEIEKQFPSNRTDLYAEGIEILLERWDSEDGIQRSIQNKIVPREKQLEWLNYLKKMLRHLAFQTFEADEINISRTSLENCLKDFLNTSTEWASIFPESQIYSKAILKILQSNHGLIIAAARNVYCFSHLTFQEYFTAEQIVYKKKIEFIAEKIFEPRWRQVFLMTTGILSNSDDLILIMKENIDCQLASNYFIEDILYWIHEKTKFIDSNNLSLKNRAFYLDHIFTPKIYSLTGVHEALLDSLFNNSIYQRMFFEFEFPYDSELMAVLHRSTRFSDDLDCDDDNLGRWVNVILGHWLYLEFELVNFAAQQENTEFSKKILKLHMQIPCSSKNDCNEDYFKEWWRTHGRKWTENFRQVIVEHHNIGHDWQLTDEKKNILQQYYDANLLLIECLKSARHVSRHVRESIEDTLLLPFEEVRHENVE